MNKTAGDLHCPSPTDLGPSGPISLPYDPTSDGVLSPVLPTLTVKKKSSVRGKILTLATDTQHPGDITGHSQRQWQ